MSYKFNNNKYSLSKSVNSRLGRVKQRYVPEINIGNPQNVEIQDTNVENISQLEQETENLALNEPQTIIEKKYKSINYSINRKSITKKIKVRKKKSKHKLSAKKILFCSLAVINSVLLLSMSTGLYLISYLQDRSDLVPEVDASFNTIALATEIYDRNGELLYRMHGDESNRDKVTLDELNPFTIAAFMAAEDSDFFNHHGISSDAIFKCTYRTLTNGKKCGGSTITQQVVKMITKRTDPTLERKIDEALLANEVENSFTKQEILELYFNLTPYGSNITGIKTAAKFYFNISDLKQLTPEQSVALASIINDPTNLAPIFSGNIEESRRKLKERQDYVYSQLADKKDSINSQLKEHAVVGSDLEVVETDLVENAKLAEVIFEKPQIDIKAGHFVNYAIKELQKKVTLKENQ
ncbi:MAG: biosynthetic peptidoglycan transglycosylase [Candidatus Dojkabacteria bacterium]|nr:biosynthetic peptidoglycan transglycosylase [Candidatus Dojkabacteria bacterium]